MEDEGVPRSIWKIEIKCGKEVFHVIGVPHLSPSLAPKGVRDCMACPKSSVGVLLPNTSERRHCWKCCLQMYPAQYRVTKVAPDPIWLAPLQEEI